MGPVKAEPSQYHEPARQFLFEPLIDAIIDKNPPKKAQSPYPPSPIIASIEFAPKESIIRKAKGSDNFPITWADDDHLYTAYGDGNGFEPYIKEKLRLDLASIKGGPHNFTGVNLRSPTL